MSHLARSLPWQHYQKHPGQLIRERDLTFKVHPLQLFVDRKQGQICSFEIRGVGGRINGCLILDDIRMHLFNAGQKKRISQMTGIGTGKPIQLQFRPSYHLQVRLKLPITLATVFRKHTILMNAQKT